MLKPVNHNSASSQIYEQLLHYIISGEWPVGTRLPSEKDLAEQFGVSRVPIREALQRLRAIGGCTFSPRQWILCVREFSFGGDGNHFVLQRCFS